MPELTFLCKEDGSGNGGCPSIYLRADGKAVIQAPEVDADTFGQFRDVLPGERGVAIDADVILRAADMIRRQQAG